MDSDFNEQIMKRKNEYILTNYKINKYAWFRINLKNNLKLIYKPIISDKSLTKFFEGKKRAERMRIHAHNINRFRAKRLEPPWFPRLSD